MTTVLITTLLLVTPGGKPIEAAALEVGFAHVDITPPIDPDRPVWLAGYFPGRQATGVHDPLFARCVVLRSADVRLALVSVDLIGLQYPVVQAIREQLPDFQYVMVASTHNHEGPDVIGVWGRSFLHRGVDDRYVESVARRVVQAIRRAERSLVEVTAAFGTAEDESLLHDSRLPEVKDPVLRLLRFTRKSDGGLAGLVVQWNCHPEALGSRNTLITADFPASTIAALTVRYQCPVVYFTGAVGGLLAPPRDRIRDEHGRLLQEGDFEFARVYGEAVARLAAEANQRAEPLSLTPFQVSAAKVGVPMTNEFYRWARLLGLLRRDGYVWNGKGTAMGERLRRVQPEVTSGIETEVGCLRLGELNIALIPGEIYPELVYGRVVDPPQEGVDFPDAPIEPCVRDMFPGGRWMLFGLANDEIGYLIPRRQWDRIPPYAYGKSAPQYGEINSCGPDAAGSVLEALKERVADAQR